MNCHASQDIGGIPGLLISSVVPGPGGGTIDRFRKDLTGHEIQFNDRLGVGISPVIIRLLNHGQIIPG